jgi:PAS domain S-box-containing protein
MKQIFKKEGKRMNENADLYCKLVEISPDAICIFNPSGKIIFSNFQTAVLYGSENTDEIKGKNISDFIFPADYPRAVNDIARVLKGEKLGKREYRLTKKDGSQFTAEANSALIENMEGLPPDILVIIRDISVNKSLLDLQTTSSYNRNLIETSLDPLVTIGSDGKITDVNAATEAVTGCSRLELIGTDFSDYFTEPNKAREGYQQVFGKGFVRDYPLEICHRNGHITPVLYNASVYHNASGNISGVFAAARDITDRKKAEENLRMASDYNRRLIETSLDPLVTIGPDGKITDVNAATESVTGFNRAELIGTDFSDYFTEPVKAREGYQQVFGKGFVRDYPLEICHRNGNVTPVLYNASVYHDNEGKIIGVFAVARDITKRRQAEIELKKYQDHLEELVSKRTQDLQTEIAERKKVEEALHKSEKELKLIMDSTPALISYIDLDFRYRRVNKNYEKWFGVKTENILGHDSREVLGEKVSSKFKENFQKALCGKKITYEDEIAPTNGVPRWVQIAYTPDFGKAGKVQGIVVHAVDISDRKRAEERIQEHVLNLEFLSKAGLQFLKMDFEQEIITYVGKQLNTLIPDAVIIMNSFDPASDSTVVNSIFGLKEDINLIEKVLGQSLIGMTFKVSPKYHRFIIGGGLQKVSKGLYGLTFEQIPLNLCRQLEIQLNIKNTYAMPFALSGDMLGSAAILTRRTEPIREAKLIEAFVGMAAVALGKTRAEEKILREKQYSEKLINNLPGIFFALDYNTNMLQINDRFSQVSGYTPEEIKNMKGPDFVAKEEREHSEKIIREIYEKGESYTEANFLCKDGRTIPYYFTGSRIIKDGKPIIIGTGVDITERKQWEEKIKESLKEKEMLLKEVHHRVKNNLQMISSILNLQSINIHNKQALEAFQESQNRIRSIALIHEKLYQTKYLSNVNIKEYISEISSKLFSSYYTALKEIKLNLKCEELYLDVDKCIAIGLILNELISNSLKHAFTDKTKGEIKINLYKENQDKLILIVSDNGKGMPKNLDYKNSETLGLQLIFTLVDQHNGTIEVNKTKGVTFKISLAV